MAKEWDYTDTFVCACGYIARTYRQGTQHENDCDGCQSILHGEEETEEEEDDED